MFIKDFNFIIFPYFNKSSGGMLSHDNDFVQWKWKLYTRGL